LNREGHLETKYEGVKTEDFKKAMNAWDPDHPNTDAYMVIKDMCQSTLLELMDKVEKECGYQYKRLCD
jgi:ATP sulfurylase